MKLINDFVKVISLYKQGGLLSAEIELNPLHVIYSGHFPGHPVTPGVIQLQIVNELLEEQLAKKLKLKIMTKCKFLKVVNPMNTPRMTIQIEFVETEDLVNIQAEGKNGGDIYFRLNADYQSWVT